MLSHEYCIEILFCHASAYGKPWMRSCFSFVLDGAHSLLDIMALMCITDVAVGDSQTKALIHLKCCGALDVPDCCDKINAKDVDINSEKASLEL